MPGLARVLYHEVLRNRILGKKRRTVSVPLLERLAMQAFTRQALSIAPASKLLYSSDGIHLPEMHWAATLRGRRVLAQVLQEMIDADELDAAHALLQAQQMLPDTAIEVYRL